MLKPLLVLLTAGLLFGCSDPDAPALSFLTIESAELMRPTRVDLTARRCTRGGGVQGGCVSYEDVPASIVAIACLPAEACIDVRGSGKEGFVTPVLETFEVSVVADVEDTRVTLTREPPGPVGLPSVPVAVIAYRAPNLDASVGNLPEPLAFPDRPVRIVRADRAPGALANDRIEVTAQLEGEALPVEQVGEGDWSTRPGRPGALVVTVLLKSPRRELERKTLRIHDTSSLDAVAAIDTACIEPGLRARQEGNAWVASFALLGTNSEGRGYVAPTLARLEGAVGTIDAAGVAQLTASPPPGAALVVTVGGASLTVPITTGGCTPRPAP